VSAISTHVLDTAAGRPAAGMRVRLERVAPAADDDAAGQEQIAVATTDADGRIAGLGPEIIAPGTYRLIFDTGGYFSRQPAGSGGGIGAGAAFFPEVAVTFAVADGRDHYHVPLLMSPFGYSTYRGS
jgi:5-hydroxyisourate hydrolase